VTFALVQTVGLTKRFDRTVALRGVALTLRPGTCTLLLGHNGAGKSTLLGILATRLRPTRGDVLYGTTPWERVDAAVRGAIGLVPHAALLYGDLTAAENLNFYAKLHGLLEPAKRIREVLGEVGMLAEADRQVRTCSRGMLQRLSLARALLHGPKLLLLDEPFTGLDQESGERLLATLADYRGRGCILLVITHRPGPLAPLCDQAVLLRAGRVGHETAGPFQPAELERLLLS